MNDILEYKNYFGSVEYSAADEIFHGRILGITDHITFEGDSVKSLKEDFAAAVEDYLESCAELGKEPEKTYKGSFNVRIDPQLHKQLAIYSMRRNQSLNKSVETAIIQMLRA